MTSLDIFCDVIDNYGDAGVCLHLARTMSHKNFKVRLFCNNIAVLQRICNEYDYQNPQLDFISWEQPLSEYAPAQCVINAFGCRFDAVTHDALLAHPSTLIIHLEYLSAETWVEECHGLPSFVDGLTTHYFFPGFTSRTGGLNIDTALTNKCLPHLQQLHAKLLADRSCATSAADCGERIVSLFGYENKTVSTIIESMSCSTNNSIIRVFEGLCLDNINTLLGSELEVGQQAKVGSVLTIEATPMVSHDEYDIILISSDFNLVRGEDSIVRAMHTGNPFLWQIYPQDEDAHIIKLQSFLDRVRSICTEEIPALIARNANAAAATDVAAGCNVAGVSSGRCGPTDNVAAGCNAAGGSGGGRVGATDDAAASTTFIEVDKDESNALLDEISKVMLAYNGSGSWPENFDFWDFEQRTAVVFYNLAVYLNRRINLSESLCSFITSKLGS